MGTGEAELLLLTDPLLAELLGAGLTLKGRLAATD